MFRAKPDRSQPARHQARKREYRLSTALAVEGEMAFQLTLETRRLAGRFEYGQPQVAVRVDLVARADRERDRHLHEPAAPPADDHPGAPGHGGVYRRVRQADAVN